MYRLVSIKPNKSSLKGLPNLLTPGFFWNTPFCHFHELMNSKLKISSCMSVRINPYYLKKTMEAHNRTYSSGKEKSSDTTLP